MLGLRRLFFPLLSNTLNALNAASLYPVLLLLFFGQLLPRLCLEIDLMTDHLRRESNFLGGVYQLLLLLVKPFVAIVDYIDCGR